MLHYYATTFDRSNTFIDAADFISTEISTLPGSSEIVPIDRCPRVFDVKNYLPQWLVSEDLEGKTLFVKFLQHYYDWYYCFNLSGIYANKIFDYIDPNSYDENVYLTALNSHLPGLSEIFLKYNYIPNIKNIIELITNIKLNFYQRKGTSQGVNIFFSTLFDEIYSVSVQTNSPNDLTIHYFYTETISLDMLNEIYEEFLHPFGMVYSSQMSEYSSSFSGLIEEDANIYRYNESEIGVTSAAYEVPKIGNYIVYNMGDTASLDYTTGCSSASPPPRGITANTANMSTHEHPNWTIKGITAFGDINISDFIFLPYEDNPNIGITSC